MEKVFRSIINIRKKNEPTIPLKELHNNYNVFLKSKLKSFDTTHIKLYDFIESFNRSYDDLPSIQYLYDKAGTIGDELLTEFLIEIAKQLPTWGSDFKAVVIDEYNQQCRDEQKTIIEKGWRILEKDGLVVGKGKKKKTLRGEADYIAYTYDNFAKYLQDDDYSDNASNLLNDSEKVISEYLNIENDPYRLSVMWFDLEKLDRYCMGIKKKDFVLLAAYMGHGKTTVAANIAYNGMAQGLSGIYITIEMSMNDIRRILYLLHVNSSVWHDGKYKDYAGHITDDMITDGRLSKKEREFFIHACKDLGKRKNDYGDLQIINPPSTPTVPWIEAEMYRHHARLKKENRQLDYVVIDYVGLIAQDEKHQEGNRYLNLNNIIRRLKRLTINFDGGRGVRIITPYQINREGYKHAQKNDGVYESYHLAESAEAEKSPDLLIALYSSIEMQEIGSVKISCLKNRGRKRFPPFIASLDYGTKKLEDDTSIKKIEVNVSDDLNIE